MNDTEPAPLRTAWSWMLQAVFLLYVLFFALPLSEAVGRVLFEENGPRNRGLGAGLLILLFASGLGTYWRIRAVRYRVRKLGKPSIVKSDVSTPGLFFAWLCYLMVGFIIAMTAIEAISGTDSLPPWMMLVVLPWVIFGIVLIVVMAGAPESEPPVPALRRKLADLVILLYQCIAYTIAWSTLFTNVKINSRWPAQGIDLLATAICFACICTGIYYVNLVERAIDPPNTPHWRRWLTAILIALCAMYPVVRRAVG